MENHPHKGDRHKHPQSSVAKHPRRRAPNDYGGKASTTGTRFLGSKAYTEAKATLIAKHLL